MENSVESHPISSLIVYESGTTEHSRGFGSSTVLPVENTTWSDVISQDAGVPQDVNLKKHTDQRGKRGHK